MLEAFGKLVTNHVIPIKCFATFLCRLAQTKSSWEQKGWGWGWGKWFTHERAKAVLRDENFEVQAEVMVDGEKIVMGRGPAPVHVRARLPPGVRGLPPARPPLPLSTSMCCWSPRRPRQRLAGPTSSAPRSSATASSSSSTPARSRTPCWTRTSRSSSACGTSTWCRS